MASKRIMIGILTGALLVAGSAVSFNLVHAESTDAADHAGWYCGGPRGGWGCGGPMGPMRGGWGDGRHMRGWADEDRPMAQDWSEKDSAAFAEDVAETYGVNADEVKAAVKDKRDFREIHHAAMLAKVSGKSFADVLGMMNKDTDWRELETKLDITPEKWRAAQDEVMAHRLADGDTLSEADARALLSEGYRVRDIERAAYLAKASSRSVRDVLAMKKINNRWSDVADALGVSYDGGTGFGPHHMGGFMGRNR